MKQFKIIKSLFFEFASYYLSDSVGEVVVLQIDYKNNSYKVLQGESVSSSEAFRQEVEELAKDLLARKHGINFAAFKNK